MLNRLGGGLARPWHLPADFARLLFGDDPEHVSGTHPAAETVLIDYPVIWRRIQAVEQPC